MKGLTPRELETIENMANGYTIHITALKMDITDSTVRMHITQAKKKIRAANLVNLVALAISQNLVTINKTEIQAPGPS
jgi:DNA-binding NarL/FixJ family response regulator